MNDVFRSKNSVKPFTSATGIALSTRFYMALGFEKILDGDVVVFRIGPSGFILSAFDQAETS